MATANRPSANLPVPVDIHRLLTSTGTRTSYGSIQSSSCVSEQNPDVEGVSPTESRSNNSTWTPPPLPLPHRFTCSYQYSPIQSKGAILVLIWNFLVFSSISGVYSIVLDSILDHLDFIPKDYAWKLTIVSTVRLSIWIFYPLAGWLADTYFGRYKTLLYGMGSIWVGCLALLVCVAVLYSCPSAKSLEHAIHLGVYPVIFVVICVGVAGFQANVVPFGMDQMQGASSDQLSSFVLWYFWTEYSFGIVYSYLLSSVDPRTFTLIQAIAQAVCMTAALILDRLFHSFLDIEPAQGNPLKIVYRVIKFAKKHRVPRQRSAFTYWEDAIPSRLDCAKQRYGGPYTTEEVEGVKTFVRITLVLLIPLLMFTSFVATKTFMAQVSSHLRNRPSVLQNSSKMDCYLGATIDNLQTYVIIVAVPIYHFLIHPIFRNLVPTTLRRIVIASIFTIATLSSTLVILTVGYFRTKDKDSIPCLLTNSTTDLYLNIDYRWVIIPNTLSGLAYLIMGSSLLEFICAQAPYTLQGFLIGATYSTAGLGDLIGFLILLGFFLSFGCSDPSPPNVDLGFGFWYYLANLVLALVGLVAAVCVVRWYRPRERDDLSFERIHVERYYEQYHSV